MTIQQALGTVDLFGDCYLWTKTRVAHELSSGHRLILLPWVLVDPQDMRRIFVNTLICPGGGCGDFTEYIQYNIDTLRGQQYASLDPDSTLYSLSTWNCGTIQDINAWINKIGQTGDHYDL